ncbi:NIL domain-containing protein [Nostoc sp.]|uniref:NIL domain-containing protein n=1 Tax=Nostoc sp. TaxID=1180 RepID=UPI003594653C
MYQSKSVEPASVHSRILMPQRYHRQPVISRLVSRYGLTVNIKAASLTSESDSDGWFDLELSGNPQKLTNSLSYLQGLGVNLLELAIANHIQLNQYSLPFPNPANKLSPKDSGWQTDQWQEQFQQSLREEFIMLK